MQTRARAPGSRTPSSRPDRTVAARPPAPAESTPPGMLRVQGLIGNQGAGRLLRHDLISRKLAYDKDWLAWLGTAWATGAGDLWARLQPKFDSDFAPAYERLEKLVAEAAVEESDQK